MQKRFGVDLRILAIGAVIAVVGFVGSVGLNFLTSTPKRTIIAARQDIPSGTQLSDLNDTNTIRLELSTDSQLLDAFVSSSDFDYMVKAGGITKREIKAKQPILKMDVISVNNEAAKFVPSLGMTDPNLVVVHIPIKQGAPNLTEGDFVDVVASVTQINMPNQALSAASFAPQTIVQSGFGQLVTPTVGPPPTATPTATPTSSPTPQVIPPISKVIVRGAIVTHIYHDTKGVSAGSNGAPASVIQGDLNSIDVLVPRDSQEVISMAISAGVINVNLLSPLADVKKGPTLGMSVSDYLDWYYSDRLLMHPQPTAVQPTPAAIQPTPTATIASTPIIVDPGQAQVTATPTK